MLSDKLLEILVCPETKQRLKFADEQTLARINQRIREGQLMNCAGNVMSEEIEAALLRDDGDVGYPVRSDIPVMLIEESFKIPD